MDYLKLIALREKASLSQEALAEKLDVSRQAISKWETGVSQPNIDNLIAMSTIYGLTLDELVSDNSAKLKILIITTGGTFAQYDENGIHVTKGSVGKQGFIESVIHNPKNRNVDFSIMNLYNIDSTSSTPNHWNLLLKTLERNHNDYDAFCITHGTNTMAQTGAALAFGLEEFQKPVLLTGSQVPYGVEGADASLNFQNMVRIAREHHDHLKGVFLVYNSFVIVGTRIKKANENDYDAFSYYQTGLIGKQGAKVFEVVDKDLLEQNNLSYGDGLKVFSHFPTHQIASITEHAGIDPDDIKLLVEKGGKKAIIYRGTGVGDITEEMIPTLKWLREKQIPLVSLSQVPISCASMDVNMPGVEAKKLGAIPAYDMNIESATIKVAYLLAKNVPYEKFAEEFHKSYKCEINVELI